jgi:hypothetical protein
LSAFFEKPFVSRVKRRIDIRIVSLWRSTWTVAIPTGPMKPAGNGKSCGWAGKAKIPKRSTRDAFGRTADCASNTDDPVGLKAI